MDEVDEVRCRELGVVRCMILDFVALCDELCTIMVVVPRKGLFQNLFNLSDGLIQVFPVSGYNLKAF